MDFSENREKQKHRLMRKLERAEAKSREESDSSCQYQNMNAEERRQFLQRFGIQEKDISRTCGGCIDLPTTVEQCLDKTDWCSVSRAVMVGLLEGK